MTRILIAGGAGFIGSHLCRYFLEEGCQVICLDDLSTGRKENIAQLMDSPSFTFLNADITEPLSIEGDVDRIYNMACPASPPRYQMDPIKTLRTNFEGTLNLLHLSRMKGARILQSSTSEVYGEPETSPQSEIYRGNVSSIGPRACYDEGKRVAETLMTDYGGQYGVSVRIARIFNTYGPHLDPADGRVVSNFIAQALAGEGLTVYGDGSQTRSFCYISDMVVGLVKLMESEYSKPVNLGNPSEITMQELATSIIAHTRSRSSITYCCLPVDDPTNRKPDIGLARKVLDWEPHIKLNQGLQETIDYFQTASKIDTT